MELSLKNCLLGKKMIDNVSLIKTEHQYDEYVLDNLSSIYELKQHFESNTVHNETVYAHTKTVFFNMLRILSKYKVNQTEILLNAAIFHDLGKCIVLKTVEGGSTISRHHEIYSALTISSEVLEKFSQNDSQIFLRTIKDHSDLHCLLDDKTNWETYFNLYKLRFPNTYINLLLLSLADILNSHLLVTEPDEYNFRVDSLTKLIKSELE